MLQFLVQQRGLLLACDAFNIRSLLGDGSIKSLALVVVMCQGSMNLSHRQVWMLTLDLLGVPVMGEAVEGNLDDFGVSAFEIRHTVSAQFDMRVGDAISCSLGIQACGGLPARDLIAMGVSPHQSATLLATAARPTSNKQLGPV